ncbi:MAG: hypothetical protein LBS23_03090 [Holosporaceae bacterium]|jgi:hypothetical protein|nr:hypothetical protein [Holosporaceae bacterium]
MFPTATSYGGGGGTGVFFPIPIPSGTRPPTPRILPELQLSIPPVEDLSRSPSTSEQESSEKLETEDHPLDRTGERGWDSYEKVDKKALSYLDLREKFILQNPEFAKDINLLLEVENLDRESRSLQRSTLLRYGLPICRMLSGITACGTVLGFLYDFCADELPILPTIMYTLREASGAGVMFLEKKEKDFKAKQIYLHFLSDHKCQV